MVQGPVLVREAIAAGARVRWLLRRLGFEFEAPNGVETYDVEPGVFDALNDTTSPQGVLAVCDMPEDPDIDCDGAWYLVAHGISDPGNLGTIIRSAEASGAHGVIVSRGTVDPFSPKAVRASAGAVLHVPIVFIDDLRDDRLACLTLVGTTSHGGAGVEELWDADTTGCIAMVLGGEAHGLSPDEPLDRWIRIPHVGRAESLNVAMAATVVAMHVGRSRTR